MTETLRCAPDTHITVYRPGFDLKENKKKKDVKSSTGPPALLGRSLGFRKKIIFHENVTKPLTCLCKTLGKKNREMSSVYREMMLWDVVGDFRVGGTYMCQRGKRCGNAVEGKCWVLPAP